MSQNTFEEVCNKEFRRGMHSEIMCEFLRKKKNPTILEFGVNTGGSTKTFISLAKELNGKVFSIDIKDCSNVSNSENWKFLKSDDLKIDYVLENFSEIRESGADLIYIDSYHENHHVSKLLNLYFKYAKKDGAIFISDIDGIFYRKKYSFQKRWTDLWQCIVYDLTSDAVREFYYNNMEKGYYCKHYGESGLGMYHKTSNFLDEPNPEKKLWNYNIFIKLFYPYLRKLVKKFKLNKN